MRQYLQRVQVRVERPVFRFCFGRGNFCFRFFNRFLYRCLFGRFGRHGCGFGFGFRRLRFGLFRFDPVQIRNVKHAARTQSAVCGNIWVCLQQRIGNLFERQVFRADGGGNLFDRFAFADGMGFAVVRRFDGCVRAVFFIGFAEGFGVLIFLGLCCRSGFAVCLAV